MKIARAFRLLLTAASAAAVSIVIASCTVSVPPGDFNVTAAIKTSAHPQYGIGNSVGYVVNGTQGLALTVVRGTTYTFGVMRPATRCISRPA